MTEALCQGISARLVEAFTRIAGTRMADVPIVNKALHVELVGAQAHGAHFLGVLVTPWFINLMILPLEAEGGFYPGTNVGDTVKLALPSGIYPCLMGEEAGIGRYLSCSFFSPVFEFAEQQAAIETASAIMTTLMEKTDGAADAEAEAWGRVLDPSAKAAVKDDAPVPEAEGPAAAPSQAGVNVATEDAAGEAPPNPSRRRLFGLGRKSLIEAQP